MNSSCVGWMCGGTKVPGGKVACQENDDSETLLGTYVWPRMFQEMPSIPVFVLVIPAVSGCMKLRPPVTRRLRGGHSTTNVPRLKCFDTGRRDAFAANLNAAM